MMRWIQTCLCAALISATSGAVEEPSSPKLESTSSSARRVELTPQLSMFAPWDFALQNPGYRVGYGEGFTGISCFQFAAATRLAYVGKFEVYGEGKIGYGTKSSLFEVVPTGQAPTQDTLRLHWMPVSAATRWMYQIQEFPYVRPTLTVGGGTLLIGQRSSFSDLNRTYLVPFVFASPALTFVDGTRTLDWFGGFVFGTSFYGSVFSPQTVRGMSFDLSLNVVL